ncbi:MAG TPA: AraC family transcriptional regulator [Vicinamibacterales bacterium]|nr:AraC family transcriptional regulator [Vicinamibacterales bacterium]
MTSCVLTDAREDLSPCDTPSRICLLNLSVGLVEDVRSTRPSRTRLEGFSPEFQLAFPYRGFFVWSVGRDEVVGDANQALFVTGGEGYRMDHPVAGGYAELIVTLSPSLICELAGTRECTLRNHPLFRRRSCRVSCAVQRLRARFLSWAGAASAIDDLVAEELVLTLVRSVLDNDTHVELPARSTQRLIQRTKAFLEAELARPIHLAEIGRAVGASPVYLTQVFRAFEGVALHQYLTQLRLARALAELPHAPDLTRLALDVGFSSHSHFSATFRRAFGTTPSAFRDSSCRHLRPCPDEFSAHGSAEPIHARLNGTR